MRREGWWRSVASKFRWTHNTLTTTIERSFGRVVQYLGRTSEYYSLRMETYAKSKARWTDRSGNARNSLAGAHEGGATGASTASFTISIAHGMPYGIWLELRFRQRYAIINKTIEAHDKEFLETAKGVMDAIGRGG